MKPFTKQQQVAIGILREWGSLERYPGGYWAAPGKNVYASPAPKPYVGTPTVQALFNARLVDVPEWHQGKHRDRMWAYPTQKLASRVAAAAEVEG